MAQEVWSRVQFGGKEYWQVESLALVEVDPDGETLFFVGTPQGGVGVLGPLVKGDPGKPALFQEGGDFTSLAFDDPTPQSLSVVEVTPGSDTQSQIVKLVAALREGKPGKDGSTSLDLSSIGGTVAPGRMLVINPGGDGINAVVPRVGGMHWPAEVTEAPAGTNATRTLGIVSVGAGTYGADWRVHVNASTVVSGSSADLRVDLVARLGAANGPVVGRGSGPSGQSVGLSVASGPDAGAADGVNRVAAGAAATVYLVAEKQSGSATFATSSTRFSIEVIAA